eukprot:4221377-Pleurochrysis_carterae.AAC.1
MAENSLADTSNIFHSVNAAFSATSDTSLCDDRTVGRDTYLARRCSPSFHMAPRITLHGKHAIQER